MNTIYFEIYISKKKVFNCEYISIEEDYSSDLDNIYFKNIKNLSNACEVKDSLEVICKISNKNNEESILSIFTLIPKKEIKINKEPSGFMIVCDVEYSEDYYFYDQSLIDLFYFWNNDFYRNIKKNERIYNLATLIYSGIPDSISGNKIVNIKGNEINNIFHFFNIIAEELIGEKSYIGSNLDSLHEILKNNKTNNSITINFFQHKNLSDTLDHHREKYFEEIKNIFLENNVVVNLL